MSLKNTKKKFDKKGAANTNDQKDKQKSNDKSTSVANKNKHIVFDDSDDEGNAINKAVASSPSPTSTPANAQNKQKKHRTDGSDIGKLWYHVVSRQFSFDYPVCENKQLKFKFRNISQYAKHNTSEVEDMKINEIEELTNHCRRCYENELSSFEKSKYSAQNSNNPLFN